MKNVVEFVNGIVRPAVTLGLTLTLIYLAVIESISAEVFMNVAGIVIGFWFSARESTKQ